MSLRARKMILLFGVIWAFAGISRSIGDADYVRAALFSIAGSLLIMSIRKLAKQADTSDFTP